jgi:hypothetical protein
MTDFSMPPLDLLAALLASFPPFLSFVVILIFLRARPGAAAALSIVSIAVSFLSAVFILV